MAVQYNLGWNLFSYFDLAIILASFLSGNRTRLTAEKGQFLIYYRTTYMDLSHISGTVINEEFRQIKADKVTINTSTEFCRDANKHVPSMKPLFPRTIDILEEKNDIAYSSSIHNDWQKDVIRMMHQHLIFLELPNDDTLGFLQEVRPNQRLGCGKIRGLLLWWRLALPCVYKKICEGNRRRGLAKTLYLLTLCNMLKYVSFSNHSF